LIIGVPKEIKAEENRVSMTPTGVEVMRQNGHTVLVEVSAGLASGFEDELYVQAGGELLDSPRDIFRRAELIMRVKEPQPSERELIGEDQIWFSYLHLAASEQLTNMLMKIGSVNIAYETVQTARGALPLLLPMSEVAGPMAIHEGAKYLETEQGGGGVLLSGVPGVDPGVVLIIGGGVVGAGAAKTACGYGAKVYVLDIDLDRLRYLTDVMPENCFLLMSSPATVRDLIRQADLVVGAVLEPGSRTPKLVDRKMLDRMKKGTVMVDVSIDQGGCFETSKETTHSNPIYMVDGILHYAVSNMPAAVPKTSSIALTNSTLPYALQIANKGWQKAMRENADLKRGANVVKGELTHQAVADAFGLECTPIDDLL